MCAAVLGSGASAVRCDGPCCDISIVPSSLINYHPADVSCCMQVLEAVLDLINSLVAADSTALATLCLVGILPAAFRLASPAQSRRCGARLRCSSTCAATAPS